MNTGVTYNTDQVKTLPEGMYLGLFHGRNAVDEELDNWGENGPVLGPLAYCHTTYVNHIRICGLTDVEAQDLQIKEDMIEFEGKYYGDWTIFYHNPKQYTL